MRNPSESTPSQLAKPVAQRAAPWALACLVTLASCNRAERRELAELQPIVDARVAALHEILDLARAEPEPGEAYEQYVALVERIDDLTRYIEALEGQGDAEGMAVALHEARDEAVAEHDALHAALGVHGEPVLDFRYEGSGNAETFFLATDDALFEARNPSSYELLSGASAPSRDLDRSRRVAALEYVLVLREVERKDPTLEGTSDDGTHDFRTGYMESDAFLYRIEDRALLSSFRFVSGSHSPTVMFGVDIALPSDPESALAVLRERLFSTAHDHAPAALAETTDGVLADHRIAHSILGATLEWTE